ncbi:PrsW family intramembrane metalloprotease [Mumia qirimensis]|uniref:PrsW family intramembrane metalloprotease n=1 Tax=Mumia qirimensis TaxID=3234852 RepID=UPI00351D418A
MTATTAPREDDVLQQRRDAIEVSGWGAPFRFLQPHNACFWVYLLLVGAGLWKLLEIALPTAEIFAQANTTAVVTSALFGLVFLLFLRWSDRFEKTPGRLAVAAFIGGGIAAPWAFALPGNAAMMDLYAKLFGQAFAEDWKAGLTAPFVEETSKAVFFVLLLGLAPVVIRTVYDGLIVGAYVGLGFQILEDMLYGQNAAAQHFGTDQASSVLHTFALRAVAGIPSHALYTALFCAGLVYLIGTVAQPRRIGRGIALIAASMLAHGIWDSMSALSGPLGGIGVLAVMLLVTVLLLAALMIAIRLGAGRERGYLRAILQPEVANGTITDAELEAVAGERKRRKHDRRAAIKARPEGVSRRREKHVLTATMDLAHDLAASRGEESVDVALSRSEIARLRGGH